MQTPPNEREARDRYHATLGLALLAGVFFTLALVLTS
jgi:hypothetical protein